MKQCYFENYGIKQTILELKICKVFSKMLVNNEKARIPKSIEEASVTYAYMHTFLNKTTLNMIICKFR